GFLYITDRKKELFKLSTGKYVAPAPIENRLICHPVIEQVVIVGNGQKFTGALIFPLVEAIRDRLGHEPSQEEVRAILQDAVDAANAGLPPWEQVKKFEVLSEPMSVETGEYTPTLKRKRAQIATRRHAEIARIYTGA
ncbi:MAG: long-chain fatty acid--CoA ligase, partial [Alphaproteobacteria bacterium]|nr:long-chain fatty acid--CoA ligase [Alphaproteobacteria bacterium]MDX5369188.1 long-chain fatty acid--CoA ligase [Alphaproteobacteria bacterium]MDX5463884.1 long-chain fatty acid--CoA ligase [Alphaproteobacteria bacterium]